MITGELKSQVDKIWEAFWTGGISNPLSVIEQFTYLLFIRRLDERQLLEEKKANLVGIPIKDEIFTSAQKELRWSSFKNKDPESMFELFVKPMVDDMTVFDHMKQVGHSAGVFADFMSKANFIIATPRLLDQVVQLIDKINMEDRDTKGDLYEYMLSKIASAGTNGQFRTPRHIIRMMVDMAKPKKDDIICDPSSGTAGFLVTAGEYYRDNHEDWFLDKDFRDHFNNEMFNGVEIDDTMIRIGAMNLQLHGIEGPNLIKNNALSESLADIRDQYTLILANPPFKGALDYDAVEGSILKTVKSKKTELLFLGLMLRMLKTGGRCAVIVPDGVLFGSSKAHKQIRQEIIENHKLDAVISMPSGVFKPYAGVSTAVLFFTKTGTGGTDKVWFYDMQADGYSLDDKRNEIKENDIPDILSRYHNMDEESSRARTDKSFLVPFDEIKENDWDLSINRYKEIVYEEIEYDPPKVIIEQIETLDRERNEALEALKKMLG
ncbi:type I restriction-modification system subunit M [Lutimonas saemankumensis]|uniref:type I restriction-modification system subunit M n=1 Tax=Lutimonas saemankumensis TaxID=483016 RepID=UPI001CD5B337|nr:class I SAM-dependent DNA methyltransferase [Lutimonas saemankumensis]MCA0933244.1 type I restriction-modification system subunit M [Lutimonas saemankumensis]